MSSRKFLSVALVHVVALHGAACFVDDDAPAVPVLDDVRTVTSLGEVRLAGTAETLANVVVSGGAEAASGAADGRTGRFEIVVPLAEGENALSVVAIDAEGNESEAATVTVVREPARAEVVRVTLPTNVIDADRGVLEVLVDIENDEPEIDLSTLTATLTIPEDTTFTPVAVAFDTSGHSVVTVEGRHTAGAFHARVEADVADPAGTKAFDVASFVVVPGAPSVVDVQLSADVGGTAVGPANAITVPANTPVDVSVTVTDVHGNLITGAPIRVDAPGSGGQVLGDTIVGITRAGTYDVLADTGSGLVAGTATLTVTAAEPDHLELTVDATTVAAGTVVTASARVVDAFGNTVIDAVPALDIDAPQEFGAPLVVEGVATATVTVTAAGAYTIEASDLASAAAIETAPLVVVAAEPVNGDFIEIDPAGLPYKAGDPVFVNYALVDAFGNVNSAVPVVVTVNAPNVSIVDNGAGVIEIDGIVRAGTYTVRARAIGSGLPDDTETLIVDPNPELAGFNLLLSAGLIAERGTLLFSATDGFGNAIDEADVTTTFSDPAAVSRVGNQLTFDRPGTFSITACITGTTLCDTEFVSVQGLVDTVPPTVVVTVESPAGTEVSSNGLIVFRADVTDDRSLSEVRFIVTFGDLGTCTRSGGPVLFPGGTTSTSRTFSINVPGCAIPLDTVNIVVQATDEAGNSRNGADTSLTVRDPFVIDVPSGGFVVGIAAFHGRLNVPQDVVADAITGQLTISNNGNDRAVVATIDRAQFDLLDQNGNRIDLLNVRGVAADAAGNRFFAVDDTNANGPGVVRVTPDLIDSRFVDSTTPGGQVQPLNTPVRGLALDETGVPALCLAARDQNRIYCFGDLGGAATRLAELGTGNNTRPIALAIDPPDDPLDNDKLFVVLDQTRVVRPFTFNAGRTTLTAISGGDISLAAFAQPGELGDIVVGPGPAENLYIAHRAGGRILKANPLTGVVEVFAEGFAQPVGLAFEGNSLLVVDESDEVVFRISPDPANPGSF